VHDHRLSDRDEDKRELDEVEEVDPEQPRDGAKAEVDGEVEDENDEREEEHCEAVADLEAGTRTRVCECHDRATDRAQVGARYTLILGVEVGSSDQRGEDA
jgi:hypothetical protein